jgi:hypothetical protein
VPPRCLKRTRVVVVLILLAIATGAMTSGAENCPASWFLMKKCTSLDTVTNNPSTSVPYLRACFAIEDTGARGAELFRN